MNKLFFIFLVCTIIGCTNKKKVADRQNLTTPQKIANAYGIDKWKNINELAFTFNVNRDTSHFERSFIYFPKTKEITYIYKQDTLHFFENKVDSTALKAHQNFVNDSFWLLAPFHLVWDKGITFKEEIEANAPISGKKLNKLSLIYGEQGGYTPGDVYEFYFNESFFIEEWKYRQKGNETITLATTWEEIKDYNEIKLNIKHQDSSKQFSLYFTNISVK